MECSDGKGGAASLGRGQDRGSPQPRSGNAVSLQPAAPGRSTETGGPDSPGRGSAASSSTGEHDHAWGGGGGGGRVGAGRGSCWSPGEPLLGGTERSGTGHRTMPGARGRLPLLLPPLLLLLLPAAPAPQVSGDRGGGALGKGFREAGRISSVLPSRYQCGGRLPVLPSRPFRAAPAPDPDPASRWAKPGEELVLGLHRSGLVAQTTLLPLQTGGQCWGRGRGAKAHLNSAPNVPGGQNTVRCHEEAEDCPPGASCRELRLSLEVTTCPNKELFIKASYMPGICLLSVPSHSVQDTPGVASTGSCPHPVTPRNCTKEGEDSMLLGLAFISPP